MNVKELKEILEEIPDDYAVAFEIVRNPEFEQNCIDDILTADYDDFYEMFEWKFLKSHCMGCYTLFIKEKVVGLQIHY